MNRKLDLHTRRFIKYCVVGGIGTLLATYGFYVFYNWLKIPDYVYVSGLAVPWAVGLSTLLAVVWNFTGNSLWTFKEEKVTDAKSRIWRFVKFCIVSAVGIVVGTGSLYAFHYWIGISYYIALFTFPIPWALGFSTLVGVAWNFVGNSLFTFRGKRANP